jgi:MYXO-CTERM domain-containing protein
LYAVFDAPGGTVVSQLIGGAGTYNVSFWLDLYSQGVPTNPLPRIAITFGDQTLNVNPVIDNKQTPAYTLFEFSNVTTAAPALLEFEASGDQILQYVSFLVDDVVVTQVASSVPEPSALGLGLMGLAGATLMTRRRQVARA